MSAVKLAESNIMELGELEKSEAKEVLRTCLLKKNQHQLEDEGTIIEFLDMLSCLALAIVQAIAFINTNDATLSNYISHYRNSEKNATDLVSEEFEDQGRYPHVKNPIATTCLRLEQTKAIGTLKAYAFISEREPQRDGQQRQTRTPLQVFDVHPLVHLAHNQWSLWAEKTLKRLVEIVPFADDEKGKIWAAYLPHAILVVDLPEHFDAEARMLLLNGIGSCEWMLGHYKAAERAFRQLLERR
ncbi:MAG: hypothetical protein M1816_004827 [Peltula sp. TS41687]|nr:MAG: hypothetical protein M1816_004827 [Peltula sp. TS41687]